MNAYRQDFIGNLAVSRFGDLAFRMGWSYGGVPINLTGHVLEFRIYTPDAYAKDGSPLILIDNAGHGGITIPAPTSGYAFYLVTQAQLVTAGIVRGRYWYTARDLSGGATTAMFYGEMEFGGAIA